MNKIGEPVGKMCQVENYLQLKHTPTPFGIKRFEIENNLQQLQHKIWYKYSFYFILSLSRKQWKFLSFFQISVVWIDAFIFVIVNKYCMFYQLI